MGLCQECGMKTGNNTQSMMICSKCWSSKYSTQYINGEHVPIKDVHKAKLKELNLWRKEGESNGDWGDRCKAFAKQNQHRRLFK
jgi:hypothetical protein